MKYVHEDPYFMGGSKKDLVFHNVEIIVFQNNILRPSQ